MKFKVSGPFELPRKTNHRLDMDNDPKRLFWEMVEEETKKPVSQGCGCYVFALRSSRGLKAWYVGKTEKRSFRYECLQSHKIVHYNEVVHARKGTPVLFLITSVTPLGRVSKPSKTGNRAINYLETLLIGMALRRNPELRNVRGAKLLQDLEVPGLVNSPKGRLLKPSLDLKKALGVT